MAEIDALKNFVLNALEVIKFKLVRERKDVNDDSIAFPPDMAHQIFGENENIFGYKDLKLTIMYNASDMYNYIDMKYAEKIEEKKGIKADDVIEKIISKLPSGCNYSNLDEFLKTLDKAEDFKPFGEKINEHIVTDNSGNKRHFEIYQCNSASKKFINFFCRLETLVLWFVDAASYIEIDDPKWYYFVCYEKIKNSNGNYQYTSAGYSTVYEFYAFPEHIRPRISQMLILPPFQKLGLGSKLLEAIYLYFLGNNVIDITVEDPSDEFRRIRNYIDAKRCMTLPSFHKDIIKKGFNEKMIKEAREKCKINPKQCRIIYEILRLYHTNLHDPQDYKEYRLNIKKRLNLPHQKQQHQIRMLEKAKIDTHLMTATMPTAEERIEQLKEEYEILENEYLEIVEKLK